MSNEENRTGEQRSWSDPNNAQPPQWQDDYSQWANPAQNPANDPQSPEYGRYGEPPSVYRQPDQSSYYAPGDYTNQQAEQPQYTDPDWVMIPPTEQQAPAKKKRGKTILLVGGLVTLLLVGVGAIAAFLLINTPAAGVERTLPPNTLGYISINAAAEGKQKEALDKLRASFESQPGFSAAWTKITQQMTDLGSTMGVEGNGTKPDVSNLDAVASYLGGNITVAILPPSTAQLQALEQRPTGEVISDIISSNIVGLIDLDYNPLNKKGPLADFKQDTQDASKLELVEKYRDTEIRKSVSGEREFYFALMGGASTAIVGAKVEPLRALIDQYKDNKGLQQDETYKALQTQVPKDRLISFYMNLSEIYRQIALAQPETNKTLSNVDGAMLLTVSALDDGMQVDVASDVAYSAEMLGANSNLAINPGAKPNASIVADVPQNAMFILVGSDLKSPIEAFLKAMPRNTTDVTPTAFSITGPDVTSAEIPMQSNPVDTAKFIYDIFDDIKEHTGVDVEADLVPLLGGDYVLSGMPSSDNTSPLASFSFQLKLKEDERAKAAQVVEKLVAGVNPETESSTIAGGTFWSIAPGNGGVAGVGADRLMVAIDTNYESGDGRKIVADTAANLGNGLGKSSDWAAASTHMLKDSNVIAYLDLEGVRTSFEKSQVEVLGQDYTDTWAPLLRPFKYLLITSSSQQVENNKSRNHSVIFLGIGQ